MGERTLTSGEVTLAKRVFKDSIDYSTVKVHNEKYLPIQPNNSGMTPNGEIYVAGAEAYFADYSSTDDPYLRAFFVHEMTHVWQYQLKILNPISSAIAESFRNFFDYPKAYDYELAPAKDLLAYRIEQQAQIVEDYYLTHIEGMMLRTRHIKNTGGTAEYMRLFPQVLAKFLASPGYARHSIVCNRDTYGPPGSRGVTCKRVLVTP